jgi:hypothetical protein
VSPAAAPADAPDKDDEEEAASWRRSRTETTITTPVMKKRTKRITVALWFLGGAVHAIA